MPPLAGSRAISPTQEPENNNVLPVVPPQPPRYSEYDNLGDFESEGPAPVQDAAAQPAAVPPATPASTAPAQRPVPVQMASEVYRGQRDRATIIETKDYAAEVQEISTRENDEDLKRMLRVAMRISPEKDDTLVPRQSLINYLKDAQKRQAKCWQIPFIFAYFVTFSLMLLAHEKIANLSQVEREFRVMIEGTGFEGYGGEVVANHLPVSGHKTLIDIDVIDDVYTFMQDAILPLMLRDTSVEKVEDYSRVLSMNRLIGGVKFQQTRKKKVNCATEYPTMGPFMTDGRNPFLDGFDCFPIDSVDDQCFGLGQKSEGFCPDKMRKQGRRLVAVENETREEILHYGDGINPEYPTNDRSTARRLSAAAHSARSRLGSRTRAILRGESAGDMYSVWFQSHEGVGTALKKLRQLQVNNWLDEQTSWAGIILFGINPDHGVFFHCTVNVFFAPSGELAPFMLAYTWLAQPYKDWLVIVYDCVWALLWLHLSARCVMGLVKAIGRGEVAHYLKNLWNIVEWLTAIGGIVMMVYWFMYLTELWNVMDRAMDVSVSQIDAASTDDEKETFTKKFLDFDIAIGTFVPFLDNGRIIFGAYTLFILIRFFRAFEAQPRLAVVTQTIVECKSDFFHFFLVFATMFLAFTVGGMILFGHRLVEFSVLFPEAIMQCMQIILGNFDFDELGAEFPLTAFLWFGAFIVLIFLIMFNMVLAIIMDVYGVAKQTAAFSDPIWEQMRLMMQDMRKLGNSVPTNEVIKVVEAMPNELVGQTALRNAMPAMSNDQATEIIRKLDVYEKHEEQQALSLSDATRLIVGIRGNLEEVARLITEIRVVQKFGKSLQQRKTGVVIAEPKEPTEKQRKRDIVARLEPFTENRIRSLEGRVEVLEVFLNEAMSYTVFRGKEFRNRLKEIEDGLRGRRDAAASINEENEPVWNGTLTDLATTTRTMFAA